MYEHYIILAVHVPISLHSQALSIPIFNDLNFSDWYEQVQFRLGVLDLHFSLLVEKLLVIDFSSDEDRTYYDTWNKSNRLSLMFM